MILSDVESQIEQLLAILDEEIGLLERKRSQLADLSVALAQRDNDVTDELLRRMEQTERLQASLDLRLRTVRAHLAVALHCDAQDLKLSDLIAKLPPMHARALDARRQQVVERAAALRQQHLQTMLLLTECARITSLLLDSMLPAGGAVKTYGQGGQNLWRLQTGTLDTEL